MDIQPQNSVGKRNRLLSALDIAVIVVVAGLAWRLFFAAPASGKLDRPTPAVALRTLEGARFDLARERGRTVVLDFYATWCAPCEEMLPYLERFRAAHPEIRLLRVDVGENPRVARAYARRHNLRDVLVDPTAAAYDAFGANGFPTLVAIDPRGRVRDMWSGVNPRIGDLLAGADAAYRAERRDAKN